MYGSIMIHKLFSVCLSLILFASCPITLPAHASQVNADPLFSFESQNGEYTFHGLGEVLEFSDRIGAIRPFYYRDKQTSEVDILYPLGIFSRERGVIFPIYRYTDKDDQDHTEFFPVFYGKYQDDSYWGIFPVYGTMYHRFGYDRARFVLLPLYADTETGDQSTYTFLWPIFSYSPNRIFGAFPLYGWEKKDDSTYQYVLWPLIHHTRGPGDNKIDSLLPLFRYDRGPTHKSISLGWPLFTYSTDWVNQHTSIDFPWPIIRFASGAYEETRVFPFYWSYNDNETYSRTNVLWPLWAKRSWHYEDTMTDEEIISILLINWLKRKTTPDGQVSSNLYLWPFFHSASDGKKSEWHFPCILPFFFDDGFSNIWGPVVSLARGASDQYSSETSILWRTIFMGKTGDTEKFSLSFLVSSTKTPDYREWGFLGNILSFRENLKQTPSVSSE